MYMRLIQAKYKPDSLSKIRQIFDEKIIPRLQKAPGCLYICLMKSEFHRNEGISISLWDTKTHRILFLKTQPGKMEEFRKIYTEQIIPALQAIKGCRYAYLTENIEQKNEVLSVTIWNSKHDVDNYEEGGRFDELKDKVEHTFSELYQWKMALEKEHKGQVVTSEDLAVKTYNIVTGKSFQ